MSQKYEGVISFEILVVVEPDDVGFHAYCPALKGLHVDGDTIEESLKNVDDAIISYLESLFKHGDPIPIGPYFKMQEQCPPPPDAITKLRKIQWPAILQTSGISSRI